MEWLPQARVDVVREYHKSPDSVASHATRRNGAAVRARHAVVDGDRIIARIHRYRFAKRGRRFGSDVELMIVYGAAIAHYGFGTPVRALPISRYLETPRETVRRHMGRLVALGLFERAEDQTFVPSKELREVEIERALRLLRQGTAGLL